VTEEGHENPEESWCPGRESNLPLPKYKPEALSLEVTSSVTDEAN
jgi:hypothetical protein